jgi:guanosine-3',5'-bis(diphosphate) 3'-pyrophosphohydrolase
VRTLRPKDDLSALDVLTAMRFRMHGEQKRKSGEPYITHPIRVALIFWRRCRWIWFASKPVCCTTLVEDTPVTMDEIRERFGDDVARCVDGVTKLSKISFANSEDRQAESLRKMLLAMTSDIRVVIVKLADRLHNMRTIGSLSAEKRQERSRRRRLISTRPLRTASAWARCAVSWRIWHSSAAA